MTSTGGVWPGWATPVLSGVTGAVLMIATLGWSAVNPTNVDWLMHSDFALHFLGWHHYRSGPWTLPLGAAPNLIWPIGSSVGLTDAIPIAAFLFKPFDALLPPVFQYIGLWLVLSVALQGVFGVLLMRLVTANGWLQFLGSLFFVLSPPLYFRVGHAALTAHWLLLACLWLSLRPGAGQLSRGLALSWALLCAISAAIQPYLWIMVVILMAAAHARLTLSAPRRLVAVTASAAASIGASLFALWQSGSFMVRTDDGLGVGGFGVWSTNLLSFVMPTERATLLAPGPIPYSHFEQYEGYAYLGLGTLLLLVVAPFGWWRRSASSASREPAWRHVPLILALGVLYLMALGPRITAGAQQVFAYDVSWWGPLQIFRTNGRMVWPVFYTVVFVALVGIVRLRPRVATTLLSTALVLQAVDLTGMLQSVRDLQVYGFRDPLVSEFWPKVLPHYDAMVMVPSNLCDRPSLDFRPFALHAGKFGLGINAGQTARYDVRRAEAYCATLAQQLRAGHVDERALYVVRQDLAPQVAAAAGAAVACTAVDGYAVCFTRASAAQWENDFDVARQRLPPLAEIARFHTALSEVYRRELGRADQPRPGALERRLEALVAYVADRVEGCEHGEASERALARLDHGARLGFCAHTTFDRVLPPADQTLEFAGQLARAPLPGPTSQHQSPVDSEGEVVWLQDYLRLRLSGTPEAEATAQVLAAIRQRIG